MELYIEETPIRDLLVLRHQVVEDERGFFMEVFRDDIFKEAGLPTNFVQLNHSKSSRAVVRGLHFQWEPPIAKLMRVTSGAALLVAVDIRKSSPTLGKWFGLEASAENKMQLYSPASFARGFCALSESAEVQYLCTGTYNPKCESGILYNDPDIGIEWPFENLLASEKDRKAQTLGQWLDSEQSEVFKY